jgi:hypothetical protein
MNEKPSKTRRAYGGGVVRQELKRGKLVWGYDKTFRQPNGKPKRFRDFTFRTKDDAEKALRALTEADWQTRYRLKSEGPLMPTTISTAVSGYQKLAEAKRAISNSFDKTGPRSRPGHLNTLQRFVDWIGPDRLVTCIAYDDFVLWIAAETERARVKGSLITLSTIKRGLNTIRAALSHAVDSGKYHDLLNYRVPKNPLNKKV